MSKGKRSKRPTTMAQQLTTCQEQNKKLIKEKAARDRTIQDLKRELGWKDNLDPKHQATIRAFLNALDTTALLASANRSIPTDGGPRAASRNPAGRPDPTPVYAFNRLVQELDHLDELTRHLNTFNRLTPDTPRARRSCRSCHKPIDHTWPRHCAWCGHPLQHQDGGPQS